VCVCVCVFIDMSCLDRQITANANAACGVVIDDVCACSVCSMYHLVPAFA
jgi:hypothetical protein